MTDKSFAPKINVENMAWVYAILFFGAVWLGRWRKTFQFPEAGPDLAGRYLQDIFLALALAGVVILLTRAMVRWIKPFHELMKLFRDLFHPMSRQEIFMVSAFSAISEEFFFRGWLQGEVGWVAASLLFGLLHVGPNRKFIPWTVFAVVMGFALGGLYEWRGNLIVPIVAHFAINYVNLRALNSD